MVSAKENEKGIAKMEKHKKHFIIGGILLAMFALWTCMIQFFDVGAIGPEGTKVGFSIINSRFHNLTGVNMTLYNITDWMGLMPIVVCVIFGCVGFLQMVKRRSIVRVDADIILLGIYYIAVIAAYIAFEMIPINYRPILINGFLEASYPSSTALLVLSVMPTLAFQVKRRIKNHAIIKVITAMTIGFSVFMVLGRLVSGVHWLTDIIGSCLFSPGLYYVYKAFVEKKDNETQGGS